MVGLGFRRHDKRNRDEAALSVNSRLALATTSIFAAGRWFRVLVLVVLAASGLDMLREALF